MKFIIKKFLVFLNNLSKNLLNINFFYWLYNLSNERSYFNTVINNKMTKFFCPNSITEWRVQTLYTKEPETIDWINKFEGNKKVFWDVGSNIGLYSIYSAIMHKNINVFSFEPSPLNLRLLSRNISENNLEKKIKIVQLPLSDKKNIFSMMNETEIMEGGALNSFKIKKNFEGKKFKGRNKFNILGTNLNFLVESKIIELPNYIKIDVDGLEHLILKGADRILKSSRIKSISIELNDNYKEQKKLCLNILKKNNFVFKTKQNSELIKNSKKFNKTFNYIFEKKSKNYKSLEIF